MAVEYLSVRTGRWLLAIALPCRTSVRQNRTHREVWVSFGHAGSRRDRRCAGRMSRAVGHGLQRVPGATKQESTVVEAAKMRARIKIVPQFPFLTRHRSLFAASAAQHVAGSPSAMIHAVSGSPRAPPRLGDGRQLRRGQSQQRCIGRETHWSEGSRVVMGWESRGHRAEPFREATPHSVTAAKAAEDRTMCRELPTVRSGCTGARNRSLSYG